MKQCYVLRVITFAILASIFAAIPTSALNQPSWPKRLYLGFMQTIKQAHHHSTSRLKREKKIAQTGFRSTWKKVHRTALTKDEIENDPLFKNRALISSLLLAGTIGVPILKSWKPWSYLSQYPDQKGESATAAPSDADRVAALEKDTGGDGKAVLSDAAPAEPEVVPEEADENEGEGESEEPKIAPPPAELVAAPTTAASTGQSESEGEDEGALTAEEIRVIGKTQEGMLKKASNPPLPPRTDDEKTPEKRAEEARVRTRRLKKRNDKLARRIAKKEEAKKRKDEEARKRVEEEKAAQAPPPNHHFEYDEEGRPIAPELPPLPLPVTRSHGVSVADLKGIALTPASQRVLSSAPTGDGAPNAASLSTVFAQKTQHLKLEGDPEGEKTATNPDEAWN